MEFRTLRADEIELRVGRTLEDGVTLLLYKDARCDMTILDESVGAMNWKREHSRDNANCTVSIWDGEKQQWVGKEDTGTESNTEKEKGLASDSFKRACTNWGIGRELYTAPHIKIKCQTFKQGDTYKLKNKYEFYGTKVSHISYDESRKITELTISDKNGNIRWSNVNKAKDIAKSEAELIKELHEAAMEEAAEEPTVEPPKGETPKDAVKKRLSEMDADSRAELLQPIDDRCKAILKGYAEELGIPIERIVGGYEKSGVEHLTKAEYADAVNRLAEYKDKKNKSKNVIVVKEG